MNLLAVVPLPYRIAALALFAVALVGFGWFKGYAQGSQKLIDWQAKEATNALRVIKGQDRVTEAVVTHYVAVQGQTKVVTQTITKEVVRYADSNAGNCLDPAWRLLHDAAAANRVPDPGLKPDGAAGAPTAAAALETVTGNYAACWRNSDRLTALQAWVREQQAVR